MKAVKRTKTEKLLLFLHFLSAAKILAYSRYSVSILTLLLEFACFALLLFLNPKAVNTHGKAILLLLSVCSVFFTCIVHSGYGTGIVYINLLLSFLVFNYISVSEKTYRQMHFIAAAVLLLLLATATLNYYNGALSSVYLLTGDKINQNMFGLFALAAVFHWFCYFDCLRSRNILVWFIELSILLLCAYYIYRSDCRSALLAFLLFLTLKVIKKRPFSDRNNKYLTRLAWIGGLLFALLYVYLYTLIPNLTILGKPLYTGRQIVWTSAFELIKKYWLFGSGTDFALATINNQVTQSAHHTLLSLWRCLGVLPTLSVILLCGKQSRGKNVKRNKTAQFAFLACLVITLFESFFMEQFLYTLFISFLISGIKVEEKEKNKLPLKKAEEDV